MTSVRLRSHETVLVTGAAGFIGWKLAAALLQSQPKRLTLFDVAFSKAQRDFAQAHGIVLVTGNIANENDVESVVVGASIVFHIASYGMSGKQQLEVKTIEAVNIQGTRHILDACLKHAVAALVYVSTYNVIFNGQTIIDGDNKLPYISSDAHTDHYSRTKCIAEQMVLQNDINSNTTTLKACAIRPAAIYGEGELRHFPRIIKLINQGLGFFAIGPADILCDWVHADNLVHSLILAAAALRDEKKAASVHNKAFHIADGHPVNNFEFIKLALGASDLFWFRVPTTCMYFFARITEVTHNLISRIAPFEPLLTKAEVCKVGCTHYMSLTPAKQALGYEPLVSYEEGVLRLQKWFAPQVLSKSQRDFALLRMLVLLAVVALLLSVLVTAF